MRRNGTVRCPRGFTLIELLVAVIVISALMGLLIVGLTRAGRFARKAAQQQTVSGMKQATTMFKGEFGFLPPLVYDGVDMGRNAGQVQVEAFSNAGPVYVDNYGRSLVNVYQLGNNQAREFLRGRDLAAFNDADPRYSKFSLSFYLAGALEAGVDGVSGPGMSAPLPDGAWAGVGDALGGSNRSYEPFLETGKRSLRLERTYFDPVEAAALGGSNPGNDANRLALVDGNGKAYRYYRWLHDANPTNTMELNIPAVLIDPVRQRDAWGDPSIDVTDGQVSLRGATWAIVGAGQNGVFGDEELSHLVSVLDVTADTDEVLVRRQAAADNVVEVGE